MFRLNYSIQFLASPARFPLSRRRPAQCSLRRLMQPRAAVRRVLCPTPVPFACVSLRAGTSSLIKYPPANAYTYTHSHAHTRTHAHRHISYVAYVPSHPLHCRRLGSGRTCARTHAAESLRWQTSSRTSATSPRCSLMCVSLFTGNIHRYIYIYVCVCVFVYVRCVCASSPCRDWSRLAPVMCIGVLLSCGTSTIHLNFNFNDLNVDMYFCFAAG